MQKITSGITTKPFVTLILPCYNEEAILQANLNLMISYLESKNYKYEWEILLINDGSKDKTGDIAEAFSEKDNRIRVIHHPTNLNLGNALQTGFCNAKGDI
ncbi:MAG: glycosyltransferase family 2 protein, partial [Bacteroidota bacterium]